MHSAEILWNAKTAPSMALRARSLVRSGDLPSALTLLESCDVQGLAPIEVGELVLLRAYVLNLLRKPGEATAMAVEARARCLSAGVPALECELHYVLAMAAWIANNDEVVLEEISAALAVPDASPLWFTRQHSYPHSIGYWRSRACELRAGAERSNANHSAQISWMRCAFAEFDKGGDADTYVEAGMLANFVDIATDIDFPGVVEFSRDRAEKITWNEFTTRQEFQVFHSLGISETMHGNHVGALRYFRRASECAPTVPLKMLAILGRSFLMREVGENLTAREEFEAASRLSRTIDWELTSLLDRCTLLSLAEQAAVFDLSEACRLIDRYDALRVMPSLHRMSRYDDRVRGEEFGARAAVARAAGERERAILLFVDALRIWTNVGYDFRAAVAAANLAELTNELRYLEIASRESQKRPNSWLARKVAKITF